MTRKWGLVLLVACSASLPSLPGAEAEVGKEAAPTGPPYKIVLRSRSAEVTPERTKDAQTSGGSIQVVQYSPDTVLVEMRGAVAAAAEQHRGGSAAMKFDLNQDFEIVPARSGLRPPRLTMIGGLMGTLSSTPEWGGSAEQAPACATVTAASQPVLKFCLKPHGVAGGQNLFVNDHEGCEAPVLPGCFSLHQTFAISATQPFFHCHHLGQSAAAVFDPEPRFAGRYNNALNPFRAVPHQDFGFGVLLRVTEEPRPATPPAPQGEPLPAPRPAKEGAPQVLPPPKPGV